MKKQLMILFLIFFSVTAQAARYEVCTGQFAFCGASGATPTGKTITVNTPTGTAEFNEAVAQCPVMTGSAVADVLGGNMQGSCEPLESGHVWSLFAPLGQVPMAPTWSVQTATPRLYISSKEANSSNMFSMDCVLGKVINGVQIADCYGPINENLRGGSIPDGTTMLTEAPLDVTFPVSGPLP
jgi:hypothetical protein